MASDYIEDLRFRLIAEAQDANATIETVGKKLLELAKIANVPIKVFANVTKDMAGIGGEFDKLIDNASRYAIALDKAASAQARLSAKSAEKVSQLQAVQQVSENDALYAQRLANQEKERKLAEQRALAFGKEAEQVNKLDAELKKLQARIKNGTATVKEYSVALANMIKPSTLAATKNIAPNLFTKDTVAQVKRTMAEIQAITKLEAGKVAAIMKTMFPNIDTRNIEAAKRSLQGIEPAANKASKGLFSLKNMARTAFGTLTAIFIFKVGQAISMFFTNTLKAASDFRSEMAELNLAEAILSKKGMDITRQEFDGFIKDIEAKSVYLSKLDATKVVADTAGAVQEFDVSKEQLKELADSIAFIQLKNKMLGREEADAAHIINAAMDARSNFFNGMGINITEALVKEKAYAMGLVKTGQELDKASRFQAVMAILTEQTANKQEELNRQLEGTPLGNQMKLQKEWADAQLRIGDAFITVRDNIIEMLNSFSPELANSVVEFFINAAREANIFIDSLQSAADGWKQLNDAFESSTGKKAKDMPILIWLRELGDLLVPIEEITAALQGLGAVIATILAPITTFFIEAAAGQDMKTALSDAGASAVEAFVSGMSTALETYVQGEDNWFSNKIREWWKKQTGVDLDALQVPKTPIDKLGEGTPTGIVPPKKDEVLENQEDLQGALEKMNQEILEAQLKLAQDMEDAAIDLGRRLEDITIEYAKKRADAEREYASRVSDINRDYANRIADINAKQQESRKKAQEDERQREREHQNKLQEMREKFLMDLDDALHARDARQILKLIKQYELDKLQSEREFALKQENARRDEELRQQSFANERAAAERDRKAKLAEAQQDYADKLAKLKADEEAERAAAQLKYEREKQDLEKAMHDRLEIIAANLVNEFNLTQDGLNAIVSLYRQYYAEVSEIYAAMQSMMAGSAAIGDSTGTTNGSGSQRGIPMAEGGTIIANQPTSVVFGEKGIEAATFTPIGRTGQDVNKIFSSLAGSGGGNMGGSVSIELLLSPDLESRIISNTLNKTAQVFTKVQRSKR